MKFIFQIARTALFLTGLLLINDSCIREDLSECSPAISGNNLKITFSYLLRQPDSREGIYPQEVKQLTVYVFDMNRTYVTEITDLNPNLEDKNYSISLSLTKGFYSFIVWGNQRDFYVTSPSFFIKEQTRMDDVRLYLDHTSRRVADFRLHSLFFASYTGTVHGTTQTIEVPLIQNTYTINLNIEGLPDGNNTYRAVIIDDNDTYRFDNAFLPSQELQYTAPCIPQERSGLKASLTTMRLHKDRNPQLKLINNVSEKVIYEANLMELLLDIEKKGRGIIDFNRMYEYDIYLLFAIDPATGETAVSIEVNNWNVVEKETIVDLSQPLPVS